MSASSWYVLYAHSWPLGLFIYVDRPIIRIKFDKVCWNNMFTSDTCFKVTSIQSRSTPANGFTGHGYLLGCFYPVNSTYPGHWRGLHYISVCIYPSTLRCEALKTQKFPWLSFRWSAAEIARGIYWNTMTFSKVGWCMRHGDILNIIGLITRGHKHKMNINSFTAPMWQVCQQLTHISANDQYWKGQTRRTYAKVSINEFLSESHLLRNSILMWWIVIFCCKGFKQRRRGIFFPANVCLDKLSMLIKSHDSPMYITDPHWEVVQSYPEQRRLFFYRAT